MASPFRALSCAETSSGRVEPMPPRSRSDEREIEALRELLNVRRERPESARKVRREKRAVSENREGQPSGFQKPREVLSFQPWCSVPTAVT